MVLTFIHSRSFLENHTQSPVEDPGEGSIPPLIFTTNFFFLETDPPSPYLRVWMTRLPLISRTGSGTDSRLKWAKSIPLLRPKRHKNPTLWGGTYLYGLYKGVLLRGWVYGLSLHKIFACTLLRVVQALKVIILPLPLSARVMCCLPLIFKPSLGRREKLPQKVGRREIYRPVPPPSFNSAIHSLSVNKANPKKIWTTIWIFWISMADIKAYFRTIRP